MRARRPAAARQAPLPCRSRFAASHQGSARRRRARLGRGRRPRQRGREPRTSAQPRKPRPDAPAPAPSPARRSRPSQPPQPCICASSPVSLFLPASPLHYNRPGSTAAMEKTIGPGVSWRLQRPVNRASIRSQGCKVIAPQAVYEFGPFRIDMASTAWSAAARRFRCRPRHSTCCVLLARNTDRVMAKSELMETLWPNTFVEEANLTQHVYTLAESAGRSAQRRAVHRNGAAARATGWQRMFAKARRPHPRPERRGAARPARARRSRRGTKVRDGHALRDRRRRLHRRARTARRRCRR